MKITTLFPLYIIFILWSFLMPLMGWTSEDCSPINLITEENSPFAKIPVYNQEKMNICYAYSAAQMVDYHMLKKGAEDLTAHPAWVALNYSVKKNRNQLEIGHTKEALEAIAEAQLCDYKTVSQTLKSWAERNDVSEARILTYIERNTPSTPGDRVPGSIPKRTDLKSANVTSVQLLSSLLVPACEKKVAVSIPAAKKYNFTQLPTDQDFLAALKNKIAELKSPLSIAYCANIWKNPDYRGIGLTRSLVRDALKRDCHYHESLVVGRKEMGGSCHLLVRNTWGTHWSKENKNWKCVCRSKLTGEYADNCSPETHSGEQYAVEGCWLPSDKLAANTGLITTLE